VPQADAPADRTDCMWPRFQRGHPPLLLGGNTQNGAAGANAAGTRQVAKAKAIDKRWRATKATAVGRRPGVSARRPSVRLARFVGTVAEDGTDGGMRTCGTPCRILRRRFVQAARGDQPQAKDQPPRGSRMAATQLGLRNATGPRQRRPDHVHLPTPRLPRTACGRPANKKVDPGPCAGGIASRPVASSVRPAGQHERVPFADRAEDRCGESVGRRGVTALASTFIVADLGARSWSKSTLGWQMSGACWHDV
jgi:hypothetical protein